MIDVRDQPDRSRYEAVLDGDVVAICDYRDDGERVLLPHTVVDPSHRGRGIGEQLVRGALDDLRRKGRRIVPMCWFVVEFVDQHPEYADLVAA